MKSWLWKWNESDFLIVSELDKTVASPTQKVGHGTVKKYTAGSNVTGKISLLSLSATLMWWVYCVFISVEGASNPSATLMGLYFVFISVGEVSDDKFYDSEFFNFQILTWILSYFIRKKSYWLWIYLCNDH